MGYASPSPVPLLARYYYQTQFEETPPPFSEKFAGWSVQEKEDYIEEHTSDVFDFKLSEAEVLLGFENYKALPSSEQSRLWNAARDIGSDALVDAVDEFTDGYALVDIHTPYCDSVLIRHLKSENEKIRSKAALSLFGHDSEVVKEALMEGVNKEDSELVRKRMVKALGQIPGDDVTWLLLDIYFEEPKPYDVKGWRVMYAAEGSLKFYRPSSEVGIVAAEYLRSLCAIGRDVYLDGTYETPSSYRFSLFTYLEPEFPYDFVVSRSCDLNSDTP